MLENIKVQVTEEQSKTIQALAFARGYTWGHSWKHAVRDNLGMFLYFKDTGRVYHGNNNEIFNMNRNYNLYYPDNLISIWSKAESSDSVRNLNHVIS